MADSPLSERRSSALLSPFWPQSCVARCGGLPRAARHGGRVPARRRLDPLAVRAQRGRGPGVLVQSWRVEFGIERPVVDPGCLRCRSRPGLPPLASAKLLGLALVGITALAAAALTRRLSGDQSAGLLAGLAVAITPRMAWAGLSGHGGAAVCRARHACDALVCASVRQRPGARAGTSWGLWAGLAGWARPETFVAAGILAIAWLLGGARDPGTRRLARGWWQPLIVLALRMRDLRRSTW